MPKAEPASRPLLLPVRLENRVPACETVNPVPPTLTASVAWEPAVMLVAVQLEELPLYRAEGWVNSSMPPLTAVVPE